MSILDQIRHYRLPTAEEELMAARMAKLERALAIALSLVDGTAPAPIVKDLLVANGRALLAEAA